MKNKDQYPYQRPLFQQQNSSNFWVANNQCSFCKEFGHQHTACNQLGVFRITRGREQAQTNLIAVQPNYDEFGFIGMLTYDFYNKHWIVFLF